jgi:hypothetical protein
MQRLEVSCAVRPIYGSLGAKGLKMCASHTVFIQVQFVIRPVGFITHLCKLNRYCLDVVLLFLEVKT